MTSFERDPNGNIVVDPNTGYPIIATDDQIHCGSIQPDYIAGNDKQTGLQKFLFGIHILMCVKVEWCILVQRVQWSLPVPDPITTHGDREPFVIPGSVVQNADGSYSANFTPVPGCSYILELTLCSVQPVVNVWSMHHISNYVNFSLSYSVPSKWSANHLSAQSL